MSSRWRQILFPREKRTRDNTISAADTQPRKFRDTNKGLRHGSQLAITSSSPRDSGTSSVTAAPADLPTVSLDINVPAPTETEHDGRPVIQRGENLGLQTLYDPPVGLNAIVDIIFVHGLTGNAYNTWFHQGKGVHWPSELLSVDLPYARIFSFGYDANIVGWWSPTSVNRIQNHAEALLGALSRRRLQTNSEQRRIIFVAHSLGGLVVQSVLDLSRSSPEVHLQKLEANTSSLAFLGTPHFGADKALWGGYGANLISVMKRTNKQLVQVLEPDSEMLALIQKKFHGILRLRQADGRPIDVTCFYEEIPLPSLGLIVEMRSAILPGYQSYGIHANHMDMTKFADSQCNDYLTVFGELQRWARTIQEEEGRTTTLQEECLRTLYFDGLETREEAIASALPGTFDWIWEEKKCSFMTWLQSGRGLYRIFGRAASGKSTMMKHICQTAQAKAEDTFSTYERPLVVAYFLDRKSKHPMTRSLEGITRAVLWQVLRQRAAFFDHVLHRYKEMKRTRPNVVWSLTELRSALEEVLSHKPSYSILVLLDALDESSEDPLDIVDFCQKLACAASEKVRICVSSREEPEIIHTFASDSVSTDTSLRIEKHTRRDIEEYAHGKLKQIKGFVDKATRQKLAQAVSQKANGLFIWVVLVCRDIVRSSQYGNSIDDLFDCLKHLQQEMNVLYLQILERRDEKSRAEAELMLGIVACAGRSLTVEELQFVMRQRIAGNSKVNGAEMQRRIDALTGGLLDYRTDRLLFCHETVSDFFWGLQRSRTTPNPVFRAHRQLAESCLLLLRECESPPSAKAHLRLSREDGRRLLELRHYSTQNWLHHFKAAKAKGSVLHEIWDPAPVTDPEFNHWRRLYLARCWEQESTYASHMHPAATSLELLMLSITPSDLFSRKRYSDSASAILDINRERGITTTTTASHDKSTVSQTKSAKTPVTPPKATNDRPVSIQSITARPRLIIPMPSSPVLIGEDWTSDFQFKIKPGDWDKYDLEHLISIEFGPGYSIDFHARQLLVTGIDTIECRINRPKNKPKNATWFQLHLADPKGIHGCRSTIKLRRCEYSSFIKPFRKMLHLKPDLQPLQEIRILAKHYLQLDSCFKEDMERKGHVSHGLEKLRPSHGSDCFATPVHYGAFYGLTFLIKELERSGANINNVSHEASYGTPLLSAIWGLNELGFQSTGTQIIQLLLLYRASPDLAGNGKNLGTVTPLKAAVSLYIGYKRRLEYGFDNMKWVIELLLEKGAQVDPATRRLALSSSGLERHFRHYISGPGSLFESFATTLSGSPFASTPPIDIPSRSSHRSSFNATVGMLGPIRTSQTPKFTRLNQTLEYHPDLPRI